MSKLTLKPETLSQSNGEKRDSGLSIKQRFSHGRTRSVTVVVKGRDTKPGDGPRVQTAGDASDLMTEIVNATLGQTTAISSPIGPYAEQHLARTAEQKARLKAERMREREAIKAIEKAQSKKTAKKKREGKLRGRVVAKPRLVDVARPNGRRKKLQVFLSDRQKDRVAQLAIGMSRGKLPEVIQAREELEYVEKIDNASWPERDRHRYLFVKAVLNAIIDGLTAQQIIQPDGKYFRWPGTKIGNSHSLDGGVEPTQEIGVLKSVGYQVGLQGVPLHERRRLLNFIFEKELRLSLDAAYLGEWGKPGTSTRLRKLAHTIASLTRNMKRRSVDAPSISDWEADLAYLKQRYYIGHYDFPWPKP